MAGVSQDRDWYSEMLHNNPDLMEAVHLLARHQHNLYSLRSGLGNVRTWQVLRWSLLAFKTTRHQPTYRGVRSRWTYDRWTMANAFQIERAKLGVIANNRRLQSNGQGYRGSV